MNKQELLNIGIEKLKNKEYDEALDFLERAKEIEPENPDIEYNIGQVYMSINSLNDALESFQNSIALIYNTCDIELENKKIVSAQIAIAQCYLKEKSFDLCFANCIQIDKSLCPSNIELIEIYLVLVNELFNVGKKEKALKLLDELQHFDFEREQDIKFQNLKEKISKNITNNGLLNDLTSDELIEQGRNKWNNGENELAIQFYNEALRKDSKNPTPIIEIAMVFESQGNYEESIEYFNRALEMGLPSIKEFLYSNIASNLYSMKKYNDSLKYYDLALSTSKGNFWEDLCGKGNCLCQLKKYTEAIVIYIKIIKFGNISNERKRNILKIICICFDNLGEPNKIIPFLKDCMGTVNIEKYYLYQLLGEYLYFEKRYDEAIIEYKNVLKYNNADIEIKKNVVNAISKCLQNLDKHDEAIEFLKKQ
ncbi:tetratricopeptide repeat protein [Floricoccus penangensis]|uniref:tetratricopeptide repeat protein n=1 Tax=Floricoccus penangensis TaxID=1859475 RepID=UPI00204017FF|nr:tetratricopeptide repeat protein [Floricoccus penangensis]URZ86616.1 tetratricopeptide repeat protein [Floricoccus penangensis]